MARQSDIPFVVPKGGRKSGLTRKKNKPAAEDKLSTDAANPPA